MFLYNSLQSSVFSSSVLYLHYLFEITKFFIQPYSHHVIRVYLWQKNILHVMKTGNFVCYQKFMGNCMGRKSAKIAARKGAADKLKSQIYTKILFEVTRAVKRGGEDVESNFLLRVALNKCRKNNVPKENIQRAIKKGLGNDGDGFTDVNYEGYGPGGVAIFVETSTDNVTRTIASIRFYFSRNGGTLGNAGSLQFLFEHKSVFEVATTGINEDDFMLAMMDAGAEDIEIEDGHFIITGAKDDFGQIQAKLEELNITPEEANLERIPTTYKKIDDATFDQVMKLIEAIEADEDVLRVFHNIEVDEE